MYFFLSSFCGADKAMRYVMAVTQSRTFLVQKMLPMYPGDQILTSLVFQAYFNLRATLEDYSCSASNVCPM